MRNPLKAPAFTALTAATVLVLTGAPASAATTRVVHQGQSIQAAVNAAHSGDTIIVEGSHREAVTIMTSGIHVFGRGALITPPSGTAHTPCGQMGGKAPKNDVGVCMLGRFDSHGNVTRPLRDVIVAGLTIRNFSEGGIIMFGGKDVVLRDNVAANDGGYGIARFVSAGGRVENNQVSGNGEAGIYVGDSPSADVLVKGNHSSGNGSFGFFFRDSSHGRAIDNVADGNCSGIIVLRTGDAPATDWTIQNNNVHDNDRACPGDEEGPPISGIGVVVVGGDRVRVLDNAISNNKPSGPSLASAGVVVLSARPFGGHDESNIAVHRNNLTNNKPKNILWDHKGTNVSLSGNSCTPSCF